MAQTARSQPDGVTIAAGVLGAAVVVGLGVAVATLGRERAARDRSEPADKRAALAAYLREHLAGSDAAIQVVEHLRLTHAGKHEGRLFAALFDEFREEREVVRILLAHLGVSPVSIKRLNGPVSGAMLAAAAGGERGELALFRILEALAIGVQGKRCMWRTLHALLGNQPIPSTRSLAGLEAMAVREWESIEARLHALATETFPTLNLSGVDAPMTDAPAAVVHIRSRDHGGCRRAGLAGVAYSFVDTFGADTTPEDMQAHCAMAYGVAQQTAELTSAGTVSRCWPRTADSWSATPRFAAMSHPPA